MRSRLLQVSYGILLTRSRWHRFSGSLSGKRKSELAEIASALELDASAKVADLVKSIQTHLDVNETSLSKTPQFKGLYVRRK